MASKHQDLVGAELHISKINVGTGTPNGSVTAGIIGEMFWDSVGNKMYVAEQATDSDWVHTGISNDTLLELSDIDISSYTGKSGFHLKVKSDETGIDTGQAVGTTDSPTFANLSLTSGALIGAIALNDNLTVNGASTIINGNFTINGLTTIINSPTTTINSPVTITDPLTLGDEVSAGDGTELVPAYTFTSDPDTGMRRVSSDVLGFSAKGFDVLQLNALTGANSFLKVTARNLGVDIDATSTTELTLGTSSGTAIGIQGLDVGIGTTTPSAKLEVVGSAIIGGDLTVSANTIIGSTSVNPDGALHVHVGSSGAVTASSVANALVVEDLTNNGISILTPDVNTGRIIFGSPSDPFGAFIAWSFSVDDFAIGSSKIGANFRLTSDQESTNITLSGGAGSELATFAKDVAINGTIKIKGGTPAIDRVLTSIDLDGNATWQVPVVSVGWVGGGGVVSLSTGTDNVGIGTQTPDTKLHVEENCLVQNLGYYRK